MQLAKQKIVVAFLVLWSCDLLTLKPLTIHNYTMSVVWNKLSFIAEPSAFEILAAKLPCSKVKEASEKVILNNVYGCINTGELVALLGPSGAGKSTLINCLISGKNYQGCKGDIYVTGLAEPIRASLINQNEGQHLLPELTVMQSLRYASRLKNPAKTPSSVHEEIVRNLIIELNLKSCENNVVEICSNGEKKRLAIGLELTAFKKPHFLFLDEPTSGLDSFVGLKVMKLLSRLAKAHNMAIVTTIHQPSYKLFLEFDKAFILTGSGEFIFNQEPIKLKHVLEDCGYIFGPGMYENPADVAIELASSMTRQNSKLLQDEHSEYAPLDCYDDTVFLVEFSYEVGNGECPTLDTSEDMVRAICKKMIGKIKLSYMDCVQPLEEPTNYENQVTKLDRGLCRNESAFNFYSFIILLLRCSHTSILKQKRFTLIKLFLHLVVALVLAMLYHRNIGKADSCIQLVYPNEDKFDCPCTVTPKTLRDQSAELSHKNVTFHFFSLLFLMFASLMPTVLSFPSEIKLFLCEYRNGWYSASAYYIAKTFTEIPFQLIFPGLYAYFLYWYSSQFGMQNWYEGILGFMSSRYSHFLWVTILCCFIAQGLGFLIGILCVRSFNISIILSSSLLLFLFLFSGFFVKRVQISESVSWLTYLSFVRFGLESILIIIYGNSRCMKPKHSSVLVIFDLEDEDLSFNVIMLLTHLVLSRVLAFVLFKYKADPMLFHVRVPSFKKKSVHLDKIVGVTDTVL